MTFSTYCSTNVRRSINPGGLYQVMVNSYTLISLCIVSITVHQIIKQTMKYGGQLETIDRLDLIQSVFLEPQSSC